MLSIRAGGSADLPATGSPLRGVPVFAPHIQPTGCECIHVNLTLLLPGLQVPEPQLSFDGLGDFDIP